LRDCGWRTRRGEWMKKRTHQAERADFRSQRSSASHLTTEATEVDYTSNAMQRKWKARSSTFFYISPWFYHSNLTHSLLNSQMLQDKWITINKAKCLLYLTSLGSNLGGMTKLNSKNKTTMVK
jgi:hypothetical protein